MQNQMINIECRYTVVCVDSYQKRVLSGRYYSPYQKDEETFESLMEFLLKMEKTLDKMRIGQLPAAVRTFSEKPEFCGAGLPEPDRQNGKAGTFLIRILFRQNASWQGSILWLEGKQEQSFRSVLELVLLMDHALTAGR